MSKRVEAAQAEYDWTGKMSTAIQAADSVMFSRKSMERAAKAVEEASENWLETGHKVGSDLNMSVAEAVVAALRGDA